MEYLVSTILVILFLFDVSESSDIVDAINMQFSCRNCSYTPISEKDFYAHANRHSFDNNFKLKCFYCDTLLSSFKVHRRHTANCKNSLEEDAVDAR